MDFEISAQMNEAVLPLAIALYILGLFLKCTPKVVDWIIPWILLVFSIIASNLLLGLSVSSTIQGVLACGMAVLGNQLYKQAQIGITQEKQKKAKR